MAELKFLEVRCGEEKELALLAEPVAERSGVV